jgi:hypothetical protein
MRIIKLYEDFSTNNLNDDLEFDQDFIMAKIKHHYSDYDVKNLVDDEIENLVDDQNLKDISRSGYEYETKREWYDERGSGAEEIVADVMVDWYENEFSQELTELQKEELSKKLINAYDSLQ